MIDWRKSARSGNANSCLEIGTFTKSSHSNYNGGCVETCGVGSEHDAMAEGVSAEQLAFPKVAEALAAGEILYLLRDSKDPGGPVLVFTEAEWAAFIKGAVDGEFNPPGRPDWHKPPLG